MGKRRRLGQKAQRQIVGLFHGGTSMVGLAGVYQVDVVQIEEYVREELTRLAYRPQPAPEVNRAEGV